MTAIQATTWWHRAVVYQIYVRSFADGDGDGVGDIAGITSRLPYLADLGVDGVWLTPCYPSPQHDHGYDVADYFNIEPEYGSLETFDAMVAEAHRLGLKVMMDVVPNHCSWDHEWFAAAVAAGPGSPERERFWFREGRGESGELPPNNWTAVFAGSAWTRVVEPDGTPGQWYLHTFTPQQPDWNWNHPDVIDQFDRMLRFWFDRGVDGFRVDAVVPVGKHPDLPDAPSAGDRRETDVALQNPYSMFRPEGHAVWRHWRHVVNNYEAAHPDRELVTVAEAYTPRRPDLLIEYVNPEEFHQTFSFDLMLAPWTVRSVRNAIEPTLNALGEVGVWPTWTLNNHDAQRSVTRYGRADVATDEAWTGNNLVNSDAPVDLEIGQRRARAAVVLLLALPGSVYLYQGEELGLPEVLDIADGARQDPIFFRTEGREIGRDGCRVPLPWTADSSANFGFSPTVDAAPAWMPQPESWGENAVDKQLARPDSPLALYRTLLRLRAELPDLVDEPLEWIDTDAPGLAEVLMFRRGQLTVVVNVGESHAALPDLGRCVISSNSLTSPRTIPGNTAAWFTR